MFSGQGAQTHPLVVFGQLVLCERSLAVVENFVESVEEDVGVVLLED